MEKLNPKNLVEDFSQRFDEPFPPFNTITEPNIYPDNKPKDCTIQCKFMKVKITFKDKQPNFFLIIQDKKYKIMTNTTKDKIKEQYKGAKIFEFNRGEDNVVNVTKGNGGELVNLSLG